MDTEPQKSSLQSHAMFHGGLVNQHLNILNSYWIFFNRQRKGGVYLISLTSLCLSVALASELMHRFEWSLFLIDKSIF